MTFRIPLLLLGLGFTCAASGAEVVPAYVADMAGEYLVVTDDGKLGCRIDLRAGPTIGGFLAVPSAECATRRLKVAEATAWDFESGIRLRDAARKPLFEFREDETTVMKTRGDAKPVTMIVQAKPGVDRAPFAPALVGRWAMKRPDGQILCEVTLSKAMSQNGGATLSLKSGSPCDAAVGRLKLTSWAVEDFTLRFYGDTDSSLSFEPTRDGFAKLDGGKPLALVRLQ